MKVLIQCAPVNHEVVGRIFDDKPTAIPSALVQSRGTFRKCDRLFVTTIDELPFSCLRIKENSSKANLDKLQCNEAQLRRSPVSMLLIPLCDNEQIFCSLYQNVSDGCVMMWMELHGMPHNVPAYCRPSSVLHRMESHGVEQASSHLRYVERHVLDYITA